MRWLAAVALVGCASKPATPSSPADPPDDPKQDPTPTTAVSTTDPIDPMADYTLYLASMRTNDYDVDVYDDGMVRWIGLMNVKSIGERHGRVPDETRRALVAMFEDAKFATLPETIGRAGDGCESTRETFLGFSPTEGTAEDITGALDQHCPQDPTLEALETGFAALLGLDLWIDGNPAPATGALPDGDHRVVTLGSGACHPDCPEWAATLYDDGLLVWTGIDHTAVETEQRIYVPAQTVADVNAQIETARFWELDDSGELPRSDGLVGFGVGCVDAPMVALTAQQKFMEANDCESTTFTRLHDVLVHLLIADQTWIAVPQPVITLERGDQSLQILDNGRLVQDGASRGWLLRHELRDLIAHFTDAQFLTAAFDARKKKCKPGVLTTLTFQTRAAEDDGCVSSAVLRALEEKVLGLRLP